MRRLSPTSFFKLILVGWAPSCCLSKKQKRRKHKLDAGERRISRQLDVVHFIQNAIMLDSLSKLSLSKADRFLIRRQPQVHLLNNDSQPSSDSATIPTNAYAVGQCDD